MSHELLPFFPSLIMLEASANQEDLLFQNALRLIDSKRFSPQRTKLLLECVPTINEILDKESLRSIREENNMSDAIGARLRAADKMLPRIEEFLMNTMEAENIGDDHSVISLIEFCLKYRDNLAKELNYSIREYLITVSLLGVRHTVRLFRNCDKSETDRKAKLKGFILYFAAIHNLTAGTKMNTFLFARNPDKWDLDLLNKNGLLFVLLNEGELRYLHARVMFEGRRNITHILRSQKTKDECLALIT